MKQSGVILLHIVRKVSLSSCNGNHSYSVCSNQYRHLEKVIAETLGHKSSKALRCYERTSSVQQKAITVSINIVNTILIQYCYHNINIVNIVIIINTMDPVALSCSHVNCFLPNHCHVNTRQGIGK